LKVAHSELPSRNAEERLIPFATLRCPSFLRHPNQPKGARAKLTGYTSHVGEAISHARPSARQSSRTSPPTWPRIIASITWVPKPLRVGWGTDGDTFTISWTEREGPLVSAPKRNGFGITVVERMAKQSVDGAVELDYAPSGFSWRLTCPASKALEPVALVDA
jgi:hypothetical protein